MGTWTGRWQLLDGELILAARLDDNERARARNPDEHLPPSAVTREWWGQPGEGSAGHAQVVEVARELNVPEHLVEDDPAHALAAIEQAILDGRLVALRHRRSARSADAPATPKASEPAEARPKKKTSEEQRHEPHIEIFPGEKYRKGIPVGRLIVFDGATPITDYEAVGGPETEEAATDEEGHVDRSEPPRSPTYPGWYVLRGPVRYVTTTWKRSTIPWDANLEEKHGEVWSQAEDHGPWIRQTGKGGAYTKAFIREQLLKRQTDKPPTPSELLMWEREAKRDFYEDEYTQTKLRDKGKWKLNDFGPAAFKLVTSAGSFRGELIHTTPDNESGKSTELVQSHGCVHIFPKDRDDLTNNGWLRDGVDVVVHPYGEKGPPVQAHPLMPGQ